MGLSNYTTRKCRKEREKTYQGQLICERNQPQNGFENPPDLWKPEFGMILIDYDKFLNLEYFCIIYQNTNRII